MAIVLNKKTGKYEIKKSPKEFYESKKPGDKGYVAPKSTSGGSSPKPGQAIYIPIEDVNKEGGIGYTKPVGGEKIILSPQKKSGGNKKITLPASIRPKVKNQIYLQSEDVYISPTYPSGQGTGIIMPPTSEQRIKLDIAEKRRKAGIISYASGLMDERIEKAKRTEIISKARKKIAEARIEEKLNVLGERLEVKEQKKPTTKVEEKLRGIISPSGVRKVYDFTAEYTLRAGEKGSDVFKSTGLVDESNVIFKQTPVKRESVKQALSDVYLFSSLSPFIKTTGELKATAKSKDIEKYKKYIEEPSAKVVKVEPEYFTESATKNILGQETRATLRDGRPTLKLKPTEAEKIKVIETRPTEKWLGEVTEVRGGKVFTGEAKITGGVYTETISYTPKITKVTRIGKGGKGTAAIYKDTKLIGEIPVTPGEIPKIKLTPTKETKIFERTFGEGGISESITTRGTGGVKIRPRKVDLSTGKLKIGRTRYVDFGEDVTLGVRQQFERYSSTEDLIRAGPQKTIKSIKGKDVSAIYRKEVGQKILYGEGEATLSKDLVSFRKDIAREELFKRTAPRVKRVIRQETKQVFTTSLILSLNDVGLTILL